MKGHLTSEGSLLKSARRVARALVRPSLWAAVDDEIREDLSDQASLGWSRWRRELWGTRQYLSVSARVAVERVTAGVGDRRSGSSLSRDVWAQDLKEAARALRLRPMTTLSVVVTVALAVGATTSVYSVVDGVLLRPLPYPESDRLARLWQTTAEWNETSEVAFRSPANRLTPLAPSYYDWLELGSPARTGRSQLPKQSIKAISSWRAFQKNTAKRANAI